MQIWDSRVYRYLNNGEQPHNYRIEKPKTYLKYLNLIEELKKEKSFNAFYEILKQKVGYVISGNRALELAFFKGKGLKEGKNKNRAIL